MFLTTFLKYFLADLPIIITTFIGMWAVLSIYLPKREKSKKWKSLILIELFEHILVPICLLFIVFYFDSAYAALFFHVSLILFIFGFIGGYLIKVRGWEEWVKMGVIAVFTYFFVFLYPYVIIGLQWFYNFNGWFLLITTNSFFIGLGLLHKYRIYKGIVEV